MVGEGRVAVLHHLAHHGPELMHDRAVGGDRSEDVRAGTAEVHQLQQTTGAPHVPEITPLVIMAHRTRSVSDLLARDQSISLLCIMVYGHDGCAGAARN